MTTNKDLKIQYKSETGIDSTTTYSVCRCEGGEDSDCDAEIESSEKGVYPNDEFEVASNDYVEWLENKLIENLKTIESIIGNEKLNIP